MSIGTRSHSNPPLLTGLLVFARLALENRSTALGDETRSALHILAFLSSWIIFAVIRHWALGNFR